MTHRKTRKHPCCSNQSDDESESHNHKPVEIKSENPNNLPKSNIPDRKTRFNIFKNENSINKPITSQNPNVKKILILDLDETLLHTIDYHFSHIIERILDNSNKSSPETSIVTIDINNSSSGKSKMKLNIPKFSTDYLHPRCNYFRFIFDNNTYYACERPRVREFLSAVCDLFDVYIYTAGLPSYAKQIIRHLCPQIKEDHCRYRDSCLFKHNRLYKNIKSFSRSLNDVLIIDDNPETHYFWPKNCIMCKQFLGEYDEKELESNEFVNNLYLELDENKNKNNANENDSPLKDQRMIAKMIDDDYLMKILLPVLINYAHTDDDVQKFIKTKAVKQLELYSCAK